MTQLGPITLQRFQGDESFHEKGRPLSYDLMSFWQWSSSDLLSNITRGIMAEYLVANAIGIADGVREEWAAYDLQTAEGLKIEVKSASYVQRWQQAKLSQVSFRVPKTRSWDSDTGQLSSLPRRQADVYVFALLAHTEQSSLDPLDVSQWQFYVLPTSVLDNRKRSQHSITLPSLLKLTGGYVGYSDLKLAIERVGRVSGA
ncbi:MAG: hypothetical protein HY794_01705 [Desulfarculus sp.]|nr:hypothetical protein [Desulfarculus sp.]